MSRLPRYYYITKWTSIGGVVGSLLIIAGAIVSMFYFKGWENEAYSPFTHFISELGNINKSPKGGVFNTAVVIGGLLFLPYIWGLGRYLNTRLGYAATAVGLITAVALVGVGWFPGNNLEPHLKAAITFFVCGMLYSGLFSVAVLRHESDRLSKWLAIPGFVALVICLLFLVMPKDSLHAFLDDAKNFRRPAFWLLPFMEWMVFATMSLWIMLTSLNLRSRMLGLARQYGKQDT